MLGRIRRVWGVVARVFGVRFAPVVTLSLFATLRALVGLGMLLDPLFFPALRRQRVIRPIVIVGNPRTGTTFLQRWLVDQRVGSGQPLWRMLYTSLLLQRGIKPLLPLLERVSPARHHSTVAHDTSLTSVETDDAAILFRYFDGFFLYGFFLAFDEQTTTDLVDPRVRGTGARDDAWWAEVWRRGMVADGLDRVVAKPFSIGARIPEFLEHYPDACLLYMARDPMEVIPSGLSLVSGVLDQRFGFWSLPEEVRRRWSERLYAGLVMLLQRFHEDWAAGRIPRERVYVVRFDRLMQDFEGVMDELLAFVGHPVDAALREEIRATAARQRAYQSKHTYDLARFGIDPERVRRDCAFFYDAFLDPRGPAGPVSTSAG